MISKVAVVRHETIEVRKRELREGFSASNVPLLCKRIPLAHRRQRERDVEGEGG